MIKAKFSISHLILISVISSNAFAQNPLPLVVGHHATGNGHQPFVLSRQVNQDHWTYSTNIEKTTAPEPHVGMTKAYCFDKDCLAVGERWDDIYNHYSMLYTSNDSGHTWSLLKDGIFSNLWFDNFTCADTNCIAVGTDTTRKNGEHSSRLMISNDFGKTWVENHYIQNLPTNLAVKYLNRAYCYKDSCFVLGKYKLSEPDTPGGNVYTLHPLLLISNDRGHTWRFNAPIPNANYNVIACTDDACMIGGSFAGQPLMLRSSDSGNSWQNIKEIQSLPIGITSGFIDQIRCSSTICTAVASYTRRTSTNEYGHALHLLGSKDKGLSWIYVPSAAETAYEVTKIACSRNTCNMIAEPHAPGRSSMLLNISNVNNGYAWNSIDHTGLFAHFKSYDVTDVTCDEESCMVFGSFNSQDNTHRSPLIFKSENHGLNWIDNSKVIGLPSVKSIYLRGTIRLSA